jgi:hypothetical protein
MHVGRAVLDDPEQSDRDVGIPLYKHVPYHARPKLAMPKDRAPGIPLVEGEILR